MELSGKIIVITGGGSGIGRELVLAALARGARVAAVDLNEAGLEETATLASAGDHLSLHVGNITDRAQMADLPEAVIAAHGAVDVVINNAGVIQPFVPVAELDDGVIDRMIAINLVGPINVTRAFLPALMARPKAHIANVASMGGFIPFPGQTMYSAAKAGVKSFTEGLYSELLDSNVGVSVIMPGAVATNITSNSGLDDQGADSAEGKALPADKAAEIILSGIEKGKLHITVGRDAGGLWVLYRLAPAWSIRFIQKMMKRMGH